MSVIRDICHFNLFYYICEKVIYNIIKPVIWKSSKIYYYIYLPISSGVGYLLDWVVSAIIWAIKFDENPIEWMNNPNSPRKKEPDMKSKSATNIYINIDSKNKAK